ncbi:hypothetical protein [Novosphingobium mangrovi (ex Huang et al. 2023)]|uniref:Uncharacterized protein n=1 Tax=Novosphingobium mangrovi (ex Huang et al. 2023) TaxID=2976432 RepID=A0ABT2I222_9SPHN|nr:hypothetical protein [Novosphingobium mangrovi (ex Huang et al. 2023)]MCT2398855.1 hypothetical protein [Novosphingobium mangrovi (ex Huang et al. 2023)]
MSPEEVVALLVLMTAVIIVVWILAGTYKRHLAFQERKLEIMASQTAEKAAQYAAQNAQLENRVRVLERIATDGGSSDIASQIEALRGTEPTEVTKQ